MEEQIIDLQDMAEGKYHLLPFDSYSTIKCFLQGFRKYYKKYVLKEEVIEKDSQFSADMRFGSLVDVIKFQPDTFNEQFLVASTNVPTGQMLEFTNALYQLTVKSTNEYGDLCKDFELLLQEAYDIVGFKRDKIEKIKERFVAEGMDYYQELRDKGNKLVISSNEFDWASNLADYISNHPHTREIINKESDSQFTVINQYKIIGKIADLEFKGMVDKMIIDEVNKLIYLYDLKIMGSNSMFSYSYLKMFYYIQNAVYTTLIRAKFPDYKVNPIKFIAVDKYYAHAPIVVGTTEKQYEEAMNGFTTKFGRTYCGLLNAIEELKWHKVNTIWDCSKRVYEAGGLVDLELSNFEEVNE